MKNLLIIICSLFLLTSCDLPVIAEDFFVVKGRVQRAIDEAGIANQSVVLITRKTIGSGLLSDTREFERKTVTTDQDGNFSTLMESKDGAFVTAVYSGDEDFYGSGIFIDYSIDEPIIINADKYIKFKISVTNTDPFDENDFIDIDLYAPGLHNVIRTGIENIGVDNTSEETSWTGTNVNSIVYYSAYPWADEFKIRWRMVKNGIETTGYTDEIPYDVDQINSFSFDY